jgi:[protein-PII] uridylyltransferase
MQNTVLPDLRALDHQKRCEIRAHHENGGTGLQVVTALSDLADHLLLQCLRTEAVGAQWDGALVAIGGYGRRELSPHSDMDLMFLFPAGHAGQTEALASHLLCLMWDLGYHVGHSARTIEDCVARAREDVVIATSLLSSRLLIGNRALFDRFSTYFLRQVVRGGPLLQALEKEQAAQGEGATQDLLAPNLKQSPGGLRDLHRIKWTAQVRYGDGALIPLHARGILSNRDYTALTFGQNLLWRIRNQLHFMAGAASDHLTVELQPEVATSFHFENRRELMRQYYTHTGAILSIAQRFHRNARPTHPWQRWRRYFQTRTIAPGFRICPEEIAVSGDVHPVDFFQDDARLFGLFLLAAQRGLRISDSVLETVQRRANETHPLPPSPDACALFSQILSTPGRIAQTLRSMHRTHLLWRVIPDFCRIQHLIQESHSHAYTVDEHAFRAVYEAELLLDESGTLGEIYRGIRRKEVLHLALLLHDVGKGEPGDHSLRGAEIAEQVALRLGYHEEDRALLIFLVRRHLILSDLAFYRDFSNEPVLLKFVREVAQPEVLHHLLILTCADIRAVGPGTWTTWKGDLILKLYREALALLTGDTPQPVQTVEEVRERLRAFVQGEYPLIWLEEVLSSLTPRYLVATPFEKIVGDLKALFRLLVEPVQLTGYDLPERGLVEYTLYTHDSETPGIFSKMTGVLAAWGFQIISAQVATHRNGMVVDRFHVIDPDGTHYRDRIAPLSRDVQAVLAGQETVEGLMLKRRRFGSKEATENQPVRVALDNESSHQFTIVDVFAPDRRGLLYVIAHTLFDLGLSVHAAKITTHIDQIVDVFYVLNADQSKVSDLSEMRRIREQLTDRIEAALRPLQA